MVLLKKEHESVDIQFDSVAQSCLTLCDPINCSTPGLPFHHQLLEFTQTHVHRVGDAIQPSHPLSSPSPPAPNPYQHQGLFQWVNSSHQWPKYWGLLTGAEGPSLPGPVWQLAIVEEYLSFFKHASLFRYPDGPTSFLAGDMALGFFTLWQSHSKNDVNSSYLSLALG